MLYFLQGLRLLTQKGLKRFVFIPLIINLMLFSVALYWLWQLLQQMITIIQSWLHWLESLDYPFDNNNVSFSRLRTQLRKTPVLSLSFGRTVALCSMIPLLNLLVMPAAVCGATALWCARFAYDHDRALQAPGARSYRKLDKYC